MAEPSSITEFLNKFPGGFARPNRYLVELMMPPGLGSSGSWSNSESRSGTIESLGQSLNREGAVQIACNSCTMPGRTLMVYPHTQHAAPFNVPYSQQYEPVTFSFYANKDLDQRKFFDIWQTAVVNINDNSLNFFTEYTQDVSIWQLDRHGDKTYGVKLYAAWPLTISEVSYEYGQNDSPVNVTVSLAFKLWKADHDQTRIVIY